MKEKELERLANIIKDIKFAMMTTSDHEGRLHSRPMATQDIPDGTQFDGKLWFFTKLSSAKVHDLEEEHEINLAYANPDKQHYVSIVGKGYISQNKSKMNHLWNPMLRAWFPEGLNDPDLALIQVKIESAEIWDSPPGKVVQLLGLAKSIVTGQAYDDRSHSEHIDLS